MAIVLYVSWARFFLLRALTAIYIASYQTKLFPHTIHIHIYTAGSFHRCPSTYRRQSLHFYLAAAAGRALAGPNLSCPSSASRFLLYLRIFLSLMFIEISARFLLLIARPLASFYLPSALSVLPFFYLSHICCYYIIHHHFSFIYSIIKKFPRWSLNQSKTDRVVTSPSSSLSHYNIYQLTIAALPIHAFEKQEEPKKKKTNPEARSPVLVFLFFYPSVQVREEESWCSLSLVSTAAI